MYKNPDSGSPTDSGSAAVAKNKIVPKIAKLNEFLFCFFDNDNGVIYFWTVYLVLIDVDTIVIYSPFH